MVNRTGRYKILFLLVLLVLSAPCWLGTAVFIVFPIVSGYIQSDPISPPAADPEAEPAFGAILESADQKWLFLFKVENRIVLTDIYGRDERVVLDIVAATNNENSELFGNISISPDRRLLAVNYFNERDSSDYWNPPIVKLLVVDITDGSAKNIQETAHFDHLVFGCFRYEDCAQGLSNGATLAITTESVVGGALDCYGSRFCENNWNRYYIYLDDQLVRVTDSGLTGPAWEPDLKLYIWAEYSGVFQMDDKGHYWHWHRGDYLGKIPRDILDES